VELVVESWQEQLGETHTSLCTLAEHRLADLLVDAFCVLIEVVVWKFLDV
jgi:hypothetical protein